MEDYGAPVQPIDEYQGAAPQKNSSRNVVLIVVAVLVVLCCCCVGVGLLFYYVLGDMLLETLDIQVWAPAFMTLI